MCEGEKPRRHSRLTYGLADLVWLTMAVAVGCACAVHILWPVGVLVWATMIVFWAVRHRPYAAVPGAALGVLIAWATLRVNADSIELFGLTALGATVGASVNAIICRHYVAGLFGLVVVLTVFLVGLATA